MRTCKFTPSLLIPSLATLLFATSVIAQEPPADAPKTPTEAFFKELDKNGDGLISLEEVKAPQQQRFRETDADGDGYISAEEAREAFARQVPPEMLEEMKNRGMPDPGDTFINNLDSDGDGRVSEAEFIQPAIDSFNRMDADGNGMVTPDEATVFFDEMQKEMMKRMEEMQKQHGQMTAPPAQD